ncbi:MAG: cytochrome b N-terminal domain-containing protein [Candidatus Angelobacter sp.]
MPKDEPQDEILQTRPQGRAWKWFDRRTGVNEILHKSLDEPIPGGARFAYVFGSGLLFLFISQIITGICLTLYYVPSAESAHVSVAYMVKEVSAGSFLRSLHAYGASAMIVVLILHFLQTFLYGSYKGKRELLWISGGVLSLLILGMAFTGYLLPWDQKAYFATSVGTNIAGQVPWIGESIRRLLRGGSAMGTLTISRFYVLHVFLIPATIFLFIATHVLMFRRAGAAGPVNEDAVKPRMATERFYPKQVVMDMSFALVLIAVLGVLSHFHPVELGPVANPNDSHYLPRPEWYYLPMFQWLKYWEGPWTVVGIIIIPTVLLILFFLLPFLDRGPERRPWRRPIPLGAVLIVLVGAIWLGILSHIHDARDPSVATQLAQQEKEESEFFHAPFEPYLASSHSATVAPAVLSALSAQGKTIFDSHGCNGCHGENGMGGAIGPALTQVGAKFADTQLIEVMRNPTAKMRAGKMMPVNLDVTSMTALSSYLRALGTSGTVTAAAAPVPTQNPPPSGTSAFAPASAQNPTPSGEAKPGAPALVATSVTSSATPVQSADTSAGRDIFKTRACFACHGEGGVGTPKGPSLLGIGGKLSAAQVTNLLQHPTARMQAGGMPPITASDQDLTSLVAYIRSRKAAPGAKQAQTVSPQPSQTAAAVTPSQEPAPNPPPPAKQPESKAQVAVSKAIPTQPGTPHVQPGKAIFDAHGCAACHGPTGAGTRLAPGLASAGQRMQPAEMVKLLRHPNPKMLAGAMPPVNLDEESMNALVTYIRSLSTPATAIAPAAIATAASPTEPGAAAVVPASVVVTPPQVPANALQTQGRAIFETHRCGSCHGAQGTGGTSAAAALAAAGGSLPPAVLTRMLRHPTNAMQQGGMPPVSITDTELEALVAYIGYVSLPRTKP